MYLNLEPNNGKAMNKGLTLTLDVFKSTIWYWRWYENNRLTLTLDVFKWEIENSSNMNGND